MELDDEICLCFHVSKRKVLSFLRVEKPQRATQLSECFGAGTGCGWCCPFLRQLFEQTRGAAGSKDALPAARDYARQRTDYVRQGGGTPPPGATPIDKRPVALHVAESLRDSPPPGATPIHKSSVAPCPAAGDLDRNG